MRDKDQAHVAHACPEPLQPRNCTTEKYAPAMARTSYSSRHKVLEIALLLSSHSPVSRLQSHGGLKLRSGEGAGVSGMWEEVEGCMKEGQTYHPVHQHLLRVYRALEIWNLHC